MGDNPFLIPKKFISVTAKKAKNSKELKKATDALNKQVYKPAKKSSLADALRATSRETMDTLESWGNQTQSVPAALFTKGQVQNGQYTTKRNLVGNPLANVQSHISAQRQTGLLPREKPGLLEAIPQGFKSARMAGRAFNEDPDVSPGVKFATGLAFDPTSYTPGIIGQAAKIPRVGKVLQGSRSARVGLRGANELVEGFQSPSTMAKYLIGGAAGTELASRTDIPGVSEGVEQFAGGLLGGGILNARRPRGVKADVTTPVPPEKRLMHNTPNVHEGPIVISPDGDLRAGFYMTMKANEHYRPGDSESMKRSYWGSLSDVPVSATGFPAQHTMKFRPKNKVIQLLDAYEPLTNPERERIKHFLKNEAPGNIDYANGLNVFSDRIRSVGHVQAIEEFSKMGWDGLKGGEEEITIWKPNDVLEPDVSPGLGEEQSLLEAERNLDYSYGGPHPYKTKAPKPNLGTPGLTPQGAVTEAINIINDTSHPLQPIAYDLLYQYNVGDITQAEFRNQWVEANANLGGSTAATPLPSETFSGFLSPKQQTELDYFRGWYPNIPEDALKKYISDNYDTDGNMVRGPYLDDWAKEKGYSLSPVKESQITTPPVSTKPNVSGLTEIKMAGPGMEIGRIKLLPSGKWEFWDGDYNRWTYNTQEEAIQAAESLDWSISNTHKAKPAPATSSPLANMTLLQTLEQIEDIAQYDTGHAYYSEAKELLDKYNSGQIDILKLKTDWLAAKGKPKVIKVAKNENGDWQYEEPDGSGSTTESPDLNQLKQHISGYYPDYTVEVDVADNVLDMLSKVPDSGVSPANPKEWVVQEAIEASNDPNNAIQATAKKLVAKYSSGLMDFDEFDQQWNAAKIADNQAQMSPEELAAQSAPQGTTNIEDVLNIEGAKPVEAPSASAAAQKKYGISALQEKILRQIAHYSDSFHITPDEVADYVKYTYDENGVKYTADEPISYIDVWIAAGKPKLGEQPKPYTTSPTGEYIPTTQSPTGPLTKATTVTMDADVFSEYTKVGGQLGSNKGGQYLHPDTGEKVYIKEYDDLGQAESEIASQGIYNALGIPAPSGKLLEGGELVNPWLEHTPLDKAQLKAELDADPEQAGKLFAAAVATSNWDHVGLVYDNMVLTEDGRLAVVDHGGTFEFRAQGGHKEYTVEPKEVKSLLDPDMGAQSASVFKDVAKTLEFKAAAKQAIDDLYYRAGELNLPVSKDIFKTRLVNAWYEVNNLPVQKLSTSSGGTVPNVGGIGKPQAMDVPKGYKAGGQPEPNYEGLFEEMGKNVPPGFKGKGGVRVDGTRVRGPRQPKAEPIVPERLVTPAEEVSVGLTGGEKAGNVLTAVKKFLIGHGVKNDAVANPLANEYLRINNVLKNQANQLGKVMQRAEAKLTIDPVTLQIDKTGLTGNDLLLAKAVDSKMASWKATLSQFGIRMKDVSEFAKNLRAEAGNETKSVADIYQEYANAIANKASDKWLGGQVAKVGADASVVNRITEGGLPTRTVNLPGAKKTKLPPEIADVIGQAVRKVHPTPSSDATKLFNGINNTLRGLWAAMDASFIGIQQLPTWADNPALASKVTHGGIRTLSDPTAFAEYTIRRDESIKGTSKPSTAEFTENGLQIAQATGEGTDIGGIGGAVQRLPVYGRLQKATNRLFTESGNFNRLMLADNLWERMESGIPIVHGLDPKNMTRAEKLQAIAKAANRSTGFADKPFGGAYGSAVFFAPRFMQSQLEMIVKAVSDGSVEGQVARRQLLKLIGAGSAITVGFNEFRGEETEFDPRSSNFMKIRNVGGTDISLFGPWDTLVRGIIRSVPHVDESGDFTMGEPQYLLRSKLSPVLSTTVDMLSGSNILGDPASPTEPGSIKNLLLPFSFRKVGNEPILSSALALAGVKSNPLSNSEVLVNKLEAAGIKESDPDFLIKKREWLAAHPDEVPKNKREDFKRSQEITTDIAARRKLNDDLTISNGQSLTDFREKRKILITEQRNRRAEVLKGDSSLKGPNAQWLNSYFKLFDSPGISDPITGELDPDKFDALVAKWSAQNDPKALEFVNSYLGAGLNTAETAYYSDMRKLESAGYFDAPRYKGMKSNLTEDEIDSLAEQVDSLRVQNPSLQSESWERSAKRLLSPGLEDDQLLDIIHSRKDKYQSDEITNLKEQYAKELLWFNPRATWSSRESFTPGKKTRSSGSNALLGAKLSPSTLKLKPSLK